MTYRFKNISGRLNALLVLEAVVRHRSFTRAAQELNLSQPTISRHIATLEDRLNRALFIRNGNQVTATAEGERLASAISLGFGHAESAWEEISLEVNTNEVTLACSFGFAENWLMPRYAQLKQVLGNTKLRIMTFDGSANFDFSRVDIAVVWDVSRVSDRPFFALFGERAFPVCSPEYLSRNPTIEFSLEALLEADLLHFDIGNTGFINWRLWFAAQGIDYRIPENAHQYDTLPFAVQAVLDGEGVGIGWQYLIDQMLDDGRVVKIGDSVTNREAAYYLQHREYTDQEAGIKNVIAWFKQAIKQ